MGVSSPSPTRDNYVKYCMPAREGPALRRQVPARFPRYRAPVITKHLVSAREFGATTVATAAPAKAATGVAGLITSAFSYSVCGLLCVRFISLKYLSISDD